MVDARLAPLPITVLQGPTIAAGEALSNALDTGSKTPVMIYVPAAWIGDGGISFQVSVDGITFLDLFHPDASEVIARIKPASAVPLDADFTSAIVWLKIRSGGRNFPIPQPADCAFSIVVV